MGRGGTIVVHSTVHPQTCRDLAEQAAAKALVFIDAPVSGGNVRAREGTLTIMVGSSEDAFAANAAILRAYATTIVRTGEPGAGQAAKLVNNTLLAAHAAIAHAALQTSEQLGLDRSGIIEIVNASSGRSYGFELFGAIGMTGFARVSSIFDKDVGLLAKNIAPDAPMRPVIALAEQLLDELRPLAP
jgi:3-hydroxyisobutyrate dehydrogenase-like beta-hydroxyacid dehydrogenase